MTVIDEVLQAEKAAAETIETAKSEAAKAVADARVKHDEVLEVEAQKLAEQERNELESHAQDVEKQASAIKSAVETDVANIERQFADKATDIKAKIKQALS